MEIKTPAASQNTLIRHALVERVKLSKGMVIMVAAVTNPNMAWKERL